jgi:hypothetical protein
LNKFWKDFNSNQIRFELYLKKIQRKLKKITIPLGLTTTRGHSGPLDRSPASRPKWQPLDGPCHPVRGDRVVRVQRMQRGAMLIGVSAAKR